MPKTVHMVLSNTVRSFDREYTYLMPDDLAARAVEGMRAMVPFGKVDKPREGYIFGVSDMVGITGTAGLKSVLAVPDDKPVLTAEMIRLCRHMKRKYICTYHDAIRCMVPPGTGLRGIRTVFLHEDANVQWKGKNRLAVRRVLEECGGECEYEELETLSGIKGISRILKEMEAAGTVSIRSGYSSGIRAKTVRVAFLAMSREETLDEIESGRIKRIQQIRILEMLLDAEFLSVQDITRFSSSSASVLDTLKKYGYIDFKDVEVKRDPYRHMAAAPELPLAPTRSQADALSDARKRLLSGLFSEILLHGVTGSGKTEVYMQLIRDCIGMGRQAIVLVPEISLTPQMVGRFKSRFGESVAVLHSRLSLGERYDQWRLIRDGAVKVVVGARSAVFAPFDRIGMIIIDEEHENTYKSEVIPKYDARDIAASRCRYSNALLLYGSATPSVETYHRALGGDVGLLEISDRANKLMLPEMELVDMRRELEDGNRSMFSRKLRQEISANIACGRQTMLFLNRRGHSSFVLCRNCGLTLKCRNCNISLTYHFNDGRLICHYCGYAEKNPEACPKCGSRHIRYFGTGTQKVEEEICREFPGCSVIRMDMDTTSYKHSHEEILKAFKEKNINIMIGTQMIAKGHDFPNVTLVGVLAADSLLNTGDYKASERTFQLVTQVAGRAGRGSEPGRVVVQTYNTEDFCITSAQTHDYKSFYSQEIKMRELMGYPPFTDIAMAMISCVNDRRASEAARTVAEELSEIFDARSSPGGPGDTGSTAGSLVLGPARAPLARIKNKYRWRIIIKCADRDFLTEALTKVSDGFKGGRDGRFPAELSVDINPASML